jgi:sphingomyelin phosphodiesterase acid-like 3
MPAPIIRLIILLVASFLLYPSSTYASSFLAMADIHFDPFATCYSAKTQLCPLLQRLRTAPVSQWHAILAAGDTSAPRYRRDTNFVLLQQNLKEAKLAVAENKADFVVVLGDNISHDFHRYYRKFARDKSHAGYQAFVRKTLEFINTELALTFPETNVMMVAGNNDTYSRNYQSVPNGEFFHEAGVLWSSLLKSTKERDVMRREFSAAGYYAVDVPQHPDLRLIVLNSVLFSKKAKAFGLSTAAMTQLDWLHQQLQQAKTKHQRVLIALHIPPALDVYITQRWRLFSVMDFWQPVYIKRFQQELATFYPQVSAILSGHMHYDWSQSLMVAEGQFIPVLGVQAVSPIFGNDPGFKIYHFDAAGSIDDADTYVYPVQGSGVWRIQHAYHLLSR